MRQLSETEVVEVAEVCDLTRFEVHILDAMEFSGLPPTEAHKLGHWFHRQIACDVRRFATVYLDSQYRLLLDLLRDPSVAAAATVTSQVWDHQDNAAGVERYIRWILDEHRHIAWQDGRPRPLSGYSADLPISGWSDIATHWIDD